MTMNSIHVLSNYCDDSDNVEVHVQLDTQVLRLVLRHRPGQPRGHTHVLILDAIVYST